MEGLLATTVVVVTVLPAAKAGTATPIVKITMARLAARNRFFISNLPCRPPDWSARDNSIVIIAAYGPGVNRFRMALRGDRRWRAGTAAGECRNERAELQVPSTSSSTPGPRKAVFHARST